MNQTPSFKAAFVQNFTALFLAVLWIISLIFTLHVMHFPEGKDYVLWATGMSSGWITAIGVALKSNSPHTVDPETTAITTSTTTTEKTDSFPPKVSSDSTAPDGEKAG